MEKDSWGTLVYLINVQNGIKCAVGKMGKIWDFWETKPALGGPKLFLSPY